MLIGRIAKPRRLARKVPAPGIQLEILEDRLVCAGGFQSAPVIPIIDANMKAHLQSVYLQGQAMGERADVFSKVGDSNSYSLNFLDPLGAPHFNSGNWAALGSYTSLENTLNYFRSQPVDQQNANSFNHASVANYGGWTSTDLLTPGLRGADIGSALDLVLPPLAAEIQETRPAIALVMIGTCEVSSSDFQLYEENLTTITQYLLSQGVIPVLSTIPQIKLSLDPRLPGQVAQFNQIIADVASANNVPLWNLAAALNSLPNQGLGSDEVHLSVGPDGSGNFSSADLSYGMNVRNLTAVQVLDKLVKVIEQNAVADAAPAPNPGVSAAPFLAGLYQSILQRPIDSNGQNLFARQLSLGFSAGEVVQEIWASPEHRQLEIASYYRQFLNRPADLAGLQWWQREFALGLSETAVETAFAASPEYLQAHPNSTAFVAGLYVDLFQRAPASSEILPWLQQLQSGQSAAAVAGELSQSQEAYRVIIDRAYRADLGRPADPAGSQYAMGVLQDPFAGFLPLAQLLLLSPEYLRKLSV